MNLESSNSRKDRSFFEASRALRRQAELNENKEDEWLVYNSTLGSYELFFRPVFGAREDGTRIKNLREYIDYHYEGMDGQLVLVDVFGSGSQLVRQLDSHSVLLKASLGIVLKDIRSEAQKAEDALRNHTVIEVDLLRPRGLMKLQQWISENGSAHIFIERGMGPIAEMSTEDEQRFFYSRLPAWHDTAVHPQGTMFLQVPAPVGLSASHNQFMAGLGKLEKTGAFEVQRAPRDVLRTAAIRIRGLEGAEEVDVSELVRSI